jgi:phage terminase small subunit
MAENHELALRDYILGMKYREIADKYNVSIDTVKSWKKRHRWERDKPVKKSAHNAPKNKSVCTQTKTAQLPESDEELNDKEQMFCYHYVRTWNATQAALKSGYTQNKDSAKVRGCLLMRKPKVKQEIERLRTLFRQDIHLDIQDFLEFCMRIIGADIGDYVAWGRRQQQVIGMYGPVTTEDDDGNSSPVMETVNFVDFGESEQLDTSVISEVKQGKDGISIKLADKKWAWEQLNKYFDWLPDKWQRNLEADKLGLERRKVEALEKKVDNEGDVTDPPQFIDDIEGDEDES